MTDTTRRDTTLRDILFDRRRELQDDVQRRIHDRRAGRPNEVRDELEHSDANISEDLEFALLQMKAETSRRIEEALDRLGIGEYGDCFECRVQISESRLLALPFAARCKTCEEKREQRQTPAWRLAQQHASLSLFSDVVSA